MEHLMRKSPGIPGVYDVMTCVQCGTSVRIAPSHVHFGVYLPEGNIRLPEKCNHALDKDVPEVMLPAYQKLFKLYQDNDSLRAFIPDCPGGHWVQIGIGVWGTPKLLTWDNWSIEIDQTVVAIWHTLPEGCGCGSKSCSPRVLVYPNGETIFIMPHGLPYPCQSTAPKELLGWERFKELAMLMYKLPAPSDLSLKWFGRDWNELQTGSTEYALVTGQPLWQIWEKSGKEMAWIYAHRRQESRAYRTLTKEEYDELQKNHPGAPGISVTYPEDDGNVIENAAPSYYETITTIPLPKTGTRIYFQTGHTSYASSSYEAQVYRAVWDGTKWSWEVSKECYAHHLQERVYRLLDDDYQPVQSPPYSQNEDWLVEVA